MDEELEALKCPRCGLEELEVADLDGRRVLQCIPCRYWLGDILEEVEGEMVVGEGQPPETNPW